ncbi:BQ2448_5705 [Microbotryum intermedium]|uniref:BQ2448_5705 protein n=1 Tax=Microbotryum intermedium TaxID=269621 RepID=A0A238F2W4_9BASI|nr:BQ2448_5705 [Microbotryum intermedium]
MASAATTATVDSSDLPLALHHPLYLAAPAVEHRRFDAQYDAAVDLLAERILAHEAEYRRTGLIHTLASRSILPPLLSTRSRGGVSVNSESVTSDDDRSDAALARRVLHQGIPINEQDSSYLFRIAKDKLATSPDAGMGSARSRPTPSEQASLAKVEPIIVTASSKSRDDIHSARVVLTKTGNSVTLLDTFFASKVASGHRAIPALKVRGTSTPSQPTHSGRALGSPTRDNLVPAASSVGASRPDRMFGDQPTRDVDSGSPGGLDMSGSRSFGRDELVLFEGGCTQVSPGARDDAVLLYRNDGI